MRRSSRALRGNAPANPWHATQGNRDDAAASCPPIAGNPDGPARHGRPRRGRHRPSGWHARRPSRAPTRNRTASIPFTRSRRTGWVAVSSGATEDPAAIGSDVVPKLGFAMSACKAYPTIHAVSEGYRTLCGWISLESNHDPAALRRLGGVGRIRSGMDLRAGSPFLATGRVALYGFSDPLRRGSYRRSARPALPTVGALTLPARPVMFANP
jgi:hypothetical protein